MTTNDQENIVKHKSRHSLSTLTLCLVVILIVAITAGSAWHITISPVITTGGHVTVNQTNAAPETGGNADEANRTVATTTYIQDTIRNVTTSTSHLCNHLTKRGTYCRHWVRGPGYCFQHRN